MRPHQWVHLAGYAWIAFLFYWFLSAWKLKATKRRESFAERLGHILPMAVAFYLLFNDAASFAWLGRRLVPFSPAIGATGLALTCAGVGFAIWARWHLGENWSGSVTLKAGHELIRTGPYRFIRHPIYTGILLATIGTTLALDEWRGVISCGLVLITFYFKARREERFLAQEFGSGFDEHARHTGMFLPRLS